MEDIIDNATHMIVMVEESNSGIRDAAKANNLVTGMETVAWTKERKWADMLQRAFEQATREQGNTQREFFVLEIKKI